MMGCSLFFRFPIQTESWFALLPEAQPCSPDIAQDNAGRALAFVDELGAQCLRPRGLGLWPCAPWTGLHVVGIEQALRT